MNTNKSQYDNILHGNRAKISDLGGIVPRFTNYVSPQTTTAGNPPGIPLTVADILENDSFEEIASFQKRTVDNNEK